MANYAGMDYLDALYSLYRGVFGSHVALRCPSCLKEFYGFDACAAVSCSSCQNWFCGLCFQGIFDWEEAHEHVRNCDHRPDGMRNGVFLKQALWERHVKGHRHYRCAAFLAGIDLPQPVKERIQADFPQPQ